MYVSPKPRGGTSHRVVCKSFSARSFKVGSLIAGTGEQGIWSQETRVLVLAQLPSWLSLGNFYTLSVSLVFDAMEIRSYVWATVSMGTSGHIRTNLWQVPSTQHSLS